MKRNPKIVRSQNVKYLRERVSERSGSAWDGKPVPGTDRTYRDVRLLAAKAVEAGRSLGEAAAMYRVSKSFVFKWHGIYVASKRLAGRIHRKGVGVWNAMASLSNRPRTAESPVRDSIRADVLRVSRMYPTFGSRKIKAYLKLDVSTSTIDKVLREAGRLGEAKRRQRNKSRGRYERRHSMDMVQIDYKTWSGGLRSIWILDDASRFILGWRVDMNQSADNAIELLDQVLGLWKARPKQVLSDHGPEFYSMSGGKGSSKFDRWCEEHGVEHIMGRVRHPQTQGKIERSHRTAEIEIRGFGRTDTLEGMRSAMGAWVEFYNTRRPHQAIGDEVPAKAFLERMSPDALAAFVEG